MDVTEITWAAGLLEGEGSFLTKTNGSMPIISCQMTDEDVVYKLQGIFGGSVYSITKQAKDYYKPTWVWNLRGEAASNVMQQLIPFMGKRRTAKIITVLDIWEQAKKIKLDEEQKRALAATDYINGVGSLRAVAKLHNTSYEAVRRAVIKLNGIVA